MIPTILKRWMTVAIVVLGVACYLGMAGQSAPVYSQDAQPEAKGEKDGEEKKGGPENLLQNPMWVMIAIMVLFFFFIILPAQRRQKREQEAILANLKKNDEVVTAAGIIGIVSLIKENEDEVTLKIDDNARIKVLKSSIVRIKTKEEPKDAAANLDTNIKPAT
jgi:preprotein translocase subunit YajC